VEKLKVHRYGVDWKSFLFAGIQKTLRHEANILVGGKTIHVVCNYLACGKKGWAGEVTPTPSPTPYSHVIRGYFVVFSSSVLGSFLGLLKDDFNCLGYYVRNADYITTRENMTYEVGV
jgi:hypothetical protein